MTVVELNIPEGVSSNGNVRVDFVPTFADYRDPQLTELAEATAQHLTAHIFAVAPTGSVTRKTKRRMGSKTAYELLGANEYTIDDLEYVYDVQNPTSETNEVYAALPEGTRGFLVFRWAEDVVADHVAGEFLDVFPVRLGPQNKMPPEADDELVVRQPVAITGPPAKDVELGPAA